MARQMPPTLQNGYPDRLSGVTGPSPTRGQSRTIQTPRRVYSRARSLSGAKRGDKLHVRLGVDSCHLPRPVDLLYPVIANQPQQGWDYDSLVRLELDLVSP